MARNQVVVYDLLTYCMHCERWLAHEGHSCVLSPWYRAQRDAERAAKLTQLRSLGVIVMIEH